MRPPAFWSQRGAMARALLPLSHLYLALVRQRLATYSAQRLPVPVICVGNNGVGGAGKTPTVIALCKLLRDAHPHVISRGYKGRYRGVVRVDPAQHSARQVGDEPLLIAAAAPCWVARRRVDAAQAAIAAGAGVIIMDDGLQNPTLHKDCSLLVIDGGYGFGNGYTLPAGPGREPLADSVAKAQAAVLIGPETVSVRTALPAALPVFTARMKSFDERWRDRRVVAFAGIGRPEKFFATLRESGAIIVQEQAFADHHPYRETELQQLLARAKAQEAALVTTQKDWVRLPPVYQAQVMPLTVELVFDRPDSFVSFIENQLSSGA